ncbi:hypothetical protein M422DRAFT_269611 [Sphaerobolus stellatus SS14]|uniref:Unplaced genomic scaffold SPHSTscaffold_216, whole genome shotgun sequence n=1 Tax=Sphaerobolus stellatus (strain SS14) TaxID=990650 RepID=A0A0C9U4B9_SPHS4|nr:hypothetical protein M422DRAFT_269611 [Sphaerobolus stellatus SS14]
MLPEITVQSVGTTIFLSLGLIAFRFIFTKWNSQTLPLPPGPKPLPIIGNALDMPQSRDWETYTEWGRKYGDVVHVNALGQHIIVLNSVEAARDLLGGRSAKYSSRPYVPMLHEPSLMDSGWSFTFMHYGDRWRRHRRLFVQHINATTTQSFEGQQLTWSRVLLRSLLEYRDPKDLEESLRHTSAGIIMRIAYGYDLKPKDDPFVEIAARMTQEVALGISPSDFLVNVFPLMRYIPSWCPGGQFKHFAAQARRSGQELVETPFQFLRHSIENGTSKSSFGANALSESVSSSDPAYIQDIKEVAATMYGAASDTTVGVMHACVLALILHPRVQELARQELDGVLGSCDSPGFRLPTHQDRGDLPYIEAIVKEATRWWQPLATGIPHATTEEDEYRGWRIPKGSVIVTNAWAILHDAGRYAEPYEFRPERFLNREGNIIDDSVIGSAFGNGRRACPGRSLAEASLFIQIASVLASFKLGLAKDVNGKDIDIGHATSPRDGFLL